jgi:hypothetical protein
MALRMGVQLGVFQAIRDNQGEGVTTQQIAEKSGASDIVVGRSNLFPLIILKEIWVTFMGRTSYALSHTD